MAATTDIESTQRQDLRLLKVGGEGRRLTQTNRIATLRELATHSIYALRASRKEALEPAQKPSKEFEGKTQTS